MKKPRPPSAPPVPFRERMVALAAEAEATLAAHPPDCRGCDDCTGWGARLRLATMRVALRKLDAITGKGVTP